MSKNKGFSNTSAQRYSLALYELSNEANSIVDIEKHSLAILNLIEKNKDFNNLIKDPTENQENLISVINKISETFKVNDLLKNFMTFLIKKRRFF
ncbi:MAG: F0F1 ATP synthase subunit delta, partial [Candidatus Pelagibacter sp.]